MHCHYTMCVLLVLVSGAVFVAGCLVVRTVIEVNGSTRCFMCSLVLVLCHYGGYVEWDEVKVSHLVRYIHMDIFFFFFCEARHTPHAVVKWVAGSNENRNNFHNVSVSSGYKYNCSIGASHC